MFAAPWIVLGIIQARILECVAIPFSRGSNPGLPYCRQILYRLSHRGSHMPCCSLQWGFNKYEMKEFSTVVPWKDQRIDSRTSHGYQNPLMPRSHSWPSVSMVPYVWVQATRLCSALVFNEKRYLHKWTCPVQIQVVFFLFPSPSVCNCT